MLIIKMLVGGVSCGIEPAMERNGV